MISRKKEVKSPIHHNSYIIYITYSIVFESRLRENVIIAEDDNETGTRIWSLDDRKGDLIMKREKAVLVLVLIGLVWIGPIQSLMAAIPEVDNAAGIYSEQEKSLTEGVQTTLLGQFYENIGQFKHADVLYYGLVPGGRIGFGTDRIFLWMRDAQSSVVLVFQGTNDVTPSARGEISHNTNYFLGERGTFTGVRGFNQVVYDNLWRGISLTYKATRLGAKYEFHIAPGADPADIRIQSEDHDALTIERSSLRIQKDDGAFVDEGLTAFQEDVTIEASFVLRDSDSFGFSVGSYDREKTLIIDPLIYSTYVGGNDVDIAYSIAVDSSGNAYVTGQSDSLNFPTMSAYDDSYNENGDIFVFKLNATGNGILYSTYIGGNGTEDGIFIVVDSFGSAYVTGTTNSLNFPTVNAYDNSHNGFEDCFALKLNATGNGLIYSTYIGGNSTDHGQGIAIDVSGNAYVTGYTNSMNFPIVNAFASFRSGSSDSFVLKLNRDGDQLLYSTYVGGTDYDRGASIVVDANYSVYVTGWTRSSDFPRVSAYDNSHNGNDDIFVFKLSAAGNDLIYSTFVGGTAFDQGFSIGLDPSYNAYVTGFTGSSNFPTVNAYDDSYNGNGDAFVFKLNTTGSGLLYSTFVGGSVNDNESHTAYDHGVSIAVDTIGNAYVAGYTYSFDFPTVNAYDPTYNGEGDCFVFKLNTEGNGLLYSTYVGGSEGEIAAGITIDSEGKVYVAGHTRSSDFPTVNAYDDSYNGNEDGFVFKLEIPVFVNPCWIVIIVIIIIIILPIGWWWRRRNP